LPKLKRVSVPRLVYGRGRSGLKLSEEVNSRRRFISVTPTGAGVVKGKEPRQIKVEISKFWRANAAARGFSKGCAGGMD
jgi:hypothetical protein